MIFLTLKLNIVITDTKVNLSHVYCKQKYTVLVRDDHPNPKVFINY